MPQFTWEIASDGAFRVKAEDPPVQARLWLAKSEARDFSYADSEKAWQADPLHDYPPGVFEGKVILGEDKYTAFYIELVYPSILGTNFSLTTPTTIHETQQKPTQVTAPEVSDYPAPTYPLYMEEE